MPIRSFGVFQEVSNPEDRVRFLIFVLANRMQIDTIYKCMRFRCFHRTLKLGMWERGVIQNEESLNEKAGCVYPR